jgi:hypothetical protein
MKTVIEVQAYGDFDINYTVCIMVHPEKMNEKELMKEFYGLQGIDSDSGLSCKQLQTVTDDFICFLELHGFKELKTYEVCFSD